MLLELTNLSRWRTVLSGIAFLKLTQPGNLGINVDSDKGCHFFGIHGNNWMWAQCERDPLMLENCFELDDIDLIRLSMTEAPSFWENIGYCQMNRENLDGPEKFELFFYLFWQYQVFVIRNRRLCYYIALWQVSLLNLDGCYQPAPSN